MSYINQLMNSKASLAIILIALLLADSINGLKWQGMGSGMNSTVLSEIWNGLGPKLNTALINNDQNSYNAFTQEISDRLNNQWDQAWNVVLTKTLANYDTILYGYAFNNQWMWFNGMFNGTPDTILDAQHIATLIVWKDFNCQNWGFLENEDAFTLEQIGVINAVTHENNATDFENDIWGVAFKIMGRLELNPLFSQGGYSLILSQDPNTEMYGRICKVIGQYRTRIFAQGMTLPGGDWYQVQYGSSYHFRTR